MPKFFFQVIDRAGAEPMEFALEFPSLDDAKQEARRALAEMASEGLPAEPLNMLAVELFDENKVPITELRLLFEEVPKLRPDVTG